MAVEARVPTRTGVNSERRLIRTCFTTEYEVLGRGMEDRVELLPPLSLYTRRLVALFPGFEKA